MSKYSSQIENKIDNYSHSTSKLIQYKHNNPYAKNYEEDSITDDNITGIESHGGVDNTTYNNLPPHN